MTPEIQAQIEALRAKVEEARRVVVQFANSPRRQWTYKTYNALRRLEHEEYEAKARLHQFLKEHEQKEEA